MTEDDRLSIYGAMLAAEDDAADDASMEKPLVRPTTLNFSGGYSTDVNGVQVPTLAYTQRLEKIVQKQDLDIKRLERYLKSLEQSFRQLRTVTNTGMGRIADLGRELDGKLDRRD